MYKFEQSPNITRGRSTDVDTIVLHYTLGPTLESAVSWFKNPVSRASAHYLISRDGKIIQMVLDEDTAWHAGKSSFNGRQRVNNFSIGIELVNWGILKVLGKDEFRAWPGKYTREYDISKFGKPEFKRGKWWPPFSKEQIDACIELCQNIRIRYPSITSNRIVGHSDIAPKRKKDPGPLCPIKLIRLDSDPVGDDAMYCDYNDSEILEFDIKEKLSFTDDRSDIFSWLDNLLIKMGRK